MGATFDEVIPKRRDLLAHCHRCDGYIDVYLNRCIDCNARHGSWLDDEHQFMRVAAVVVAIILLALGLVWFRPMTLPADCVTAVGAPGSPVPPPCIVAVEPGAETNGATP